MRVGVAPNWTTPESLVTLPYQTNLPIIPRVVAGSLDNRFVVWSDNVANYISPQAYYRQWNGTAWSAEATIGVSANGWSEDWASLLLDGNNAAHLLWSGINQEIFYSTTGVTGTSASLISIQVTDSANNIVTSFDTNDEGWYSQNPITVTVTVTNPTATVFGTTLQTSFGSGANTTRFYVWREDANCSGEATPYEGKSYSSIGYDADCVLTLEPYETRSFRWGVWVQPSVAGQLELRAQLLAGGVPPIAQDLKSFAVPLAKIHPFVIVAGMFGSQQTAVYWFYGPLIDTLERMGYERNRTLFGYDYVWLNRNADTARIDLPDKLNQWQQTAADVPWVDKDGQVAFDMLGHSQGVLVVRSYLQLATNYNPVNKALLVGGPNKGVLMAYRAREGLEPGEVSLFEVFLKLILPTIAPFCGHGNIVSQYPFPPFPYSTEQEQYEALHDTDCGALSLPEFLPVPNPAHNDPPYLKDAGGNAYPYSHLRNPLLESQPASTQDDPWFSASTEYFNLNTDHLDTMSQRLGGNFNNLYILYNDALPT